jgi:SOS-response transcriptional repressor LexA
MDFIHEYSDEQGIMPSIREIRDACDIGSTNTVSWNLDKLEEAGYLTRHRRIARGIVLNTTD